MAGVPSLPQPTHVPVSPSRYVCPFCNMGIGHTKRAYQKSSSKWNAKSTTCAVAPIATKSDWEWKRITAFNDHVVKRHARLFQRANSNEFYCGFCPCDNITYESSTCSATFPRFQDLLEHLRSRHAQTTDVLTNCQHRCAPISDQSYLLPAVRDAAARLL